VGGTSLPHPQRSARPPRCNGPEQAAARPPARSLALVPAKCTSASPAASATVRTHCLTGRPRRRRRFPRNVATCGEPLRKLPTGSDSPAVLIAPPWRVRATAEAAAPAAVPRACGLVGWVAAARAAAPTRRAPLPSGASGRSACRLDLRPAPRRSGGWVALRPRRRPRGRRVLTSLAWAAANRSFRTKPSTRNKQNSTPAPAPRQTTRGASQKGPWMAHCQCASIVRTRRTRCVSLPREYPWVVPSGTRTARSRQDSGLLVLDARG
jgi:hypothetical protein